MKTAIEKDESHFDKMKREAQEWLEKDRNVNAPPFLHLALREFKSTGEKRGTELHPVDLEQVMTIDLREELRKYAEWFCKGEIDAEGSVKEYLKQIK